MNRRQMVITLPAAAAFLVGCDSEQRPARTATLLNNGEVQSAMKTLAWAIDALVGDVSEFDTENWREVVPQVTSSSENVSSAFEQLRKALSVSDSAT